MSKKTADPFIKTNEELTKLKGSDPDSSTPREQPKQQKAGGLGHQLPQLERWTTEELQQHAESIGIQGPDQMSREQLISKINERLGS